MTRAELARRYGVSASTITRALAAAARRHARDPLAAPAPPRPVNPEGTLLRWWPDEFAAIWAARPRRGRPPSAPGDGAGPRYRLACVATADGAERRLWSESIDGGIAVGARVGELLAAHAADDAQERDARRCRRQLAAWRGEEPLALALPSAAIRYDIDPPGQA
jgi:hypothetical protein